MNRIIPNKFLLKCAIILIAYQIFELLLYGAFFFTNIHIPMFFDLFPQWGPTIIGLLLFAISFIFYRNQQNYGFLCLGIMQIIIPFIRLVRYIYDFLYKIPDVPPQFIHTGTSLSESIEYRMITYHVYIVPLLFIIALAHFSAELKKVAQQKNSRDAVPSPQI